MRPHVPLFGAALLVGALTTVVFAQPRTDGGVGAPTRRDASVATARDATARDATARDATTTSATLDAGRPRAGMDAGRSADAAATDATDGRGSIVMSSSASVISATSTSQPPRQIPKSRDAVLRRSRG